MTERTHGGLETEGRDDPSDTVTHVETPQVCQGLSARLSVRNRRRAELSASTASSLVCVADGKDLDLNQIINPLRMFTCLSFLPHLPHEPQFPLIIYHQSIFFQVTV